MGWFFCEKTLGSFRLRLTTRPLSVAEGRFGCAGYGSFRLRSTTMNFIGWVQPKQICTDVAPQRLHHQVFHRNCRDVAVQRLYDYAIL